MYTNELYISTGSKAFIFWDAIQRGNIKSHNFNDKIVNQTTIEKKKTFGD